MNQKVNVTLASNFEAFAKFKLVVNSLVSKAIDNNVQGMVDCGFPGENKVLIFGVRDQDEDNITVWAIALDADELKGEDKDIVQDYLEHANDLDNHEYIKNLSDLCLKLFQADFDFPLDMTPAKPIIPATPPNVTFH